MMVENLLNLAFCLMVNFVNILYILEINRNSPNVGSNICTGIYHLKFHICLMYFCHFELSRYRFVFFLNSHCNFFLPVLSMFALCSLKLCYYLYIIIAIICYFVKTFLTGFNEMRLNFCFTLDLNFCIST